MLYCKFVAVLLVFTATSASPSYLSGFHNSEEYHHHKPEHYFFEYKVHEPKTGDEKMHREARIGDVVKGFYRLKDPDGTTREVHYTADKYNGFRAVVKRIGQPVHAKPAYFKHYNKF